MSISTLVLELQQLLLIMDLTRIWKLKRPTASNVSELFRDKLQGSGVGDKFTSLSYTVELRGWIIPISDFPISLRFGFLGAKDGVLNKSTLVKQIKLELQY